MGRTIHYRIQETIPETKTAEIEKKVSEINEEKTWEIEDIKLFDEESPFDKEKIWGFTKVRESKDVEIVLESLKSISSKFPNLTWIISAEGEPSRLTIKNGEVIESK